MNNLSSKQSTTKPREVVSGKENARNIITNQDLQHNRKTSELQNKEKSFALNMNQASSDGQYTEKYTEQFTEQYTEQFDKSEQVPLSQSNSRPAQSRVGQEEGKFRDGKFFHRAKENQDISMFQGKMNETSSHSSFHQQKILARSFQKTENKLDDQSSNSRHVPLSVQRQKGQPLSSNTTYNQDGFEQVEESDQHQLTRAENIINQSNNLQTVNDGDSSEDPDIPIDNDEEGESSFEDPTHKLTEKQEVINKIKNILSEEKQDESQPSQVTSNQHQVYSNQEEDDNQLPQFNSQEQKMRRQVSPSSDEYNDDQFETSIVEPTQNEQQLDSKLKNQMVTGDQFDQVYVQFPQQPPNYDDQNFQFQEYGSIFPPGNDLNFQCIYDENGNQQFVPAYDARSFYGQQQQVAQMVDKQNLSNSIHQQYEQIINDPGLNQDGCFVETPCIMNKTSDSKDKLKQQSRIKTLCNIYNTRAPGQGKRHQAYGGKHRTAGSKTKKGPSYNLNSIASPEGAAPLGQSHATAAIHGETPGRAYGDAPAGHSASAKEGLHGTGSQQPVQPRVMAGTAPQSHARMPQIPPVLSCPPSRGRGPQSRRRADATGGGAGRPVQTLEGSREGESKELGRGTRPETAEYTSLPTHADRPDQEAVQTDHRDQSDIEHLAKDLIKDLSAHYGFTFNSYGSTSDYNRALREQGVALPPLPNDRLVVTAGYTHGIWRGIQQFTKGVNQLSIYQHPFEVYTQMVISKVQNDFRDHQGTRVSVFQVSPENEAHVDFGILQKAMTQGEGKDLVYHKSIDMHLHKTYGCWYGCKFVVVFDSLVYSATNLDGQSQETGSQLVDASELKTVKALLEKDTPASALEARLAISHGSEFRYEPDMLRFHFPNLPAHLYLQDPLKGPSSLNSAIFLNSEPAYPSDPPEGLASRDTQAGLAALVPEPRIPFEQSPPKPPSRDSKGLAFYTSKGAELKKTSSQPKRQRVPAQQQASADFLTDIRTGAVAEGDKPSDHLPMPAFPKRESRPGENPRPQYRGKGSSPPNKHQAASVANRSHISAMGLKAQAQPSHLTARRTDEGAATGKNIGLKFQFIHKRQSNGGPSQDDARKNTLAEGTVVLTQLGGSYDASSHAADRDGNSHRALLCQAQMTDDQPHHPKQAGTGKPVHFVSSMRKGNIKYPYGYHKARKSQTSFQMPQSQIGKAAQSPPQTADAAARSQVASRAGEGQRAPLNARAKAPLNWSTLKSEDNTTSKSQTHIAPRSLFHHQLAANTAATNMYTLYQSSHRRGAQSNYMSKRGRPQANQAKRHNIVFADSRVTTKMGHNGLAEGRETPTRQGAGRPATQGGDRQALSNELLAVKSDNISYNTMHQKSFNTFKESHVGFRHLFHQGANDKGNTNLEQEVKFKDAYRGISKRDIMEYPAKEIVSRIQANIDHSQKQMQQARTSELRRRMQDAAALNDLNGRVESAKQRYLLNKDAKSLEEYHCLQKRLWELQAKSGEVQASAVVAISNSHDALSETQTQMLENCKNGHKYILSEIGKRKHLTWMHRSSNASIGLVQGGPNRVNKEEVTNLHLEGALAVSSNQFNRNVFLSTSKPQHGLTAAAQAQRGKSIGNLQAAGRHKKHTQPHKYSSNCDAYEKQSHKSPGQSRGHWSRPQVVYSPGSQAVPVSRPAKRATQPSGLGTYQAPVSLHKQRAGMSTAPADAQRTKIAKQLQPYQNSELKIINYD